MSTCPDCDFTLKHPDRCRCGWHRPAVIATGVSEYDLNAIRDNMVRQANDAVPDFIKRMTQKECVEAATRGVQDLMRKMRKQG